MKRTLTAIALVAMLAGCAETARMSRMSGDVVDSNGAVERFVTLEEMQDFMQSCKKNDTSEEYIRCQCESNLELSRDYNGSIPVWKMQAFHEIMAELYSDAAAYDAGQISQGTFEERANALGAQLPEIERRWRKVAGSHVLMSIREVRCGR